MRRIRRKVDLHRHVRSGDADSIGAAATKDKVHPCAVLTSGEDHEIKFGLIDSMMNGAT
jgi:hypothetical protein